MSDLEKFIHTEGRAIPVVVQAALVHAQFETIHPFLDGNGRVGRLLITLQLCSAGVLDDPLLYLSLFFKQHRAEYYRLLGAIRKEGDWEDWLRFFLLGVAETAEAAVSTARRLIDLFDKDQIRIRKKGRQAGSLLRVHDALKQRPLCTVAEAAKCTGLSFPTAVSALESLVVSGIVRGFTGKKRNRVFVYDKFLAVLNEGTGPLWARQWVRHQSRSTCKTTVISMPGYGNTRSITSGTRTMKRTPLVCQFKISLHGSVVPVWRRIQVPAKYSFWDLHVGIQDSMGWLDYHLHRFEFRQGRKRIEIGLPDEEDNEPILAGWEIGILEYFVVPGVNALYEYDFGDSWMHEVLLEAISLPTEGKTYPRCFEGERACPPEDCGGVGGHAELVKVLKGPRNEEYRSMRRWLKGHTKIYWPFEPARFDPDEVRFTDPRKRFRIAFEDPGK